MTCRDFMPNSFISPKPQQVQSIKQHSQNGNNRQLQPLPYLEASHGDSSSRVEMGARDWFGRGLASFMNVCRRKSFVLCSLSLSLQPQLLPSLAWEIQMNKAAIPLHLGGAHSQTSARSLAEYWNIWLRTKRIRREPEFLCACSSRSVSCLPGCSIKDLSVTKYFVSLWTFIETQAP